MTIFQLGRFPRFLEKIDKSEIKENFDEKKREYIRFIQRPMKLATLDFFIGKKKIDVGVHDVLFWFWWILNKNDPVGQNGDDSWPALYKIAKGWIIPAPPKGTGSRSHSNNKNILRQLEQLRKKAQRLQAEFQPEADLLPPIRNEINSATTDLLCAEHLCRAHVEQHRTSHYWEKEGASELINILGDRKKALAVIRTLFKALEENGIMFQPTAKNWPSRISKMKKREPAPPSTRPSPDEINAGLDKMVDLGLMIDVPYQ